MTRKTQSRREHPLPAPPRERKLFVLDTNVLMHDPNSLFAFEEHDVFLPMVTLEELDGNKRGMTEVARNTRSVSRELDKLAENTRGVNEGIPLSSTGHREATGKLFFQTGLLSATLPLSLPNGKADNQILGVVQALKEKHGDTQVILVSKDINMRVKARALGLNVQDYLSDKAIEDADILHAGVMELPQNFWQKFGQHVESWVSGGHDWYRVSGKACEKFYPGCIVYLPKDGDREELSAIVREMNGNTATMESLTDYTSKKNAVWGIVAKNREQSFALNLLLDPEIDFVTLTGKAGTGKTLATLAAGISQVLLGERRYSEIIITRVTVPIGEDIGFLPGTEEDKMGPWMGALHDNLEVLERSHNVMEDEKPIRNDQVSVKMKRALQQSTGPASVDTGKTITKDLIASKIKVKSLNFVRGRSFFNKFVIVDEAQNLTPKQMKTLITRAGPGTKIVCLGNLAQIDTPYLTEGSSGLTFAVDRFKGWPHGGHMMLVRGERSRLADFAEEVL